ncbi:MAG: hypothetical protein FJ130_02460 [Deltaproteobacteria bacterium]|nr:hypothetical protein [Deltaproteobacteria bacterium]
MTIGGVSIILLLGILNFLLILFQLSTGLHWFKVPFGFHRKTGVTLLICATLHGLLAFLAS